MNRMPLLICAALSLSGCIREGTTWAPLGPTTVISGDWDDGQKPSFLTNGRAGIVYDPDGCQNWIIDDGEEGYSTPRFNPETGLPVCDDRYPPGTVLGHFERPTDEVPDFVPNQRLRTAD